MAHPAHCETRLGHRLQTCETVPSHRVPSGQTPFGPHNVVQYELFPLVTLTVHGLSSHESATPTE